MIVGLLSRPFLLLGLWLFITRKKTRMGLLLVASWHRQVVVWTKKFVSDILSSWWSSILCFLLVLYNLASNFLVRQRYASHRFDYWLCGRMINTMVCSSFQRSHTVLARLALRKDIGYNKDHATHEFKMIISWLERGTVSCRAWRKCGCTKIMAVPTWIINEKINYSKPRTDEVFLVTGPIATSWCWNERWGIVTIYEEQGTRKWGWKQRRRVCVCQQHATLFLVVLVLR